jgi:hypothetical protein
MAVTATSCLNIFTTGKRHRMPGGVLVRSDAYESSRQSRGNVQGLVDIIVAVGPCLRRNSG